MSGWLEVVEGGALTTVQDGGRPGLAHLGVSPSGYLDRRAARLANRLVGNGEGDAVLETTGRGPTLRLRDARHSTVFAVTGAEAEVSVDGRPVDLPSPVLLRDSQSLTIGAAHAGLRSYLAIRGGLLVDAVLGSCSRDLLSGLGPPPLAPGQRLPIGNATRPVPASDEVALAGVILAPTLRIHAGPRADWFTPDALQTLTSAQWTVSSESSRVGLRLTGPTVQRNDSRELAPEGMVTGALQVPPNGQPVLLLADHPTTGGYPVIAVVAEDDLDLAGQAAPGTSIRFRLISGRV